MKCPNCGKYQTYVIREQNGHDELWRTRFYRCDVCEQIFQTVEVYSKELKEKLKEASANADN